MSLTQAEINEVEGQGFLQNRGTELFSGRIVAPGTVFTAQNFADLAELAEKYSTDTAEGGYYENIYQGQMTSAFDSWIFDPARQPGDVEIVHSDDYSFCSVSLCRGRDNHAFCTGFNMFLCVFWFRKETGRLNYYVYTELLPGQIGRVAFGADLDDK